MLICPHPLHSCVNRRRWRKPNTHTHTSTYTFRLVPYSPCVSDVGLLGLIHIFTEECPSSGGIRLNTCPESRVVSGHLSAPLLHSPLQPAHPLSSPPPHPCYLLSHPSPLLPFVLFLCSFHSLHFQLNTQAVRTRLDSKPILPP